MYVARAADRALLAAIVENERFPYIMAPRQSGKSSLVWATIERLRQGDYGVVPAFVDLSTLVGSMATASLLFKAVAEVVASELDVPSPDGPALSQLDLFRFMKGLVAKHLPNRVVIFLDEADALLGEEARVRDAFFSNVRSFFNARTAQEPSLRNLQFVLVGAARVEDLVSSKAISPFNVGIHVKLDNLSRDDISLMLHHFDNVGTPTSPNVADEIHRFTGGAVYLVQLVLEELWKRSQWYPEAPVSGDHVRRVVEHIVSTAGSDLHFTHIRDSITGDPALTAAFIAYAAGERPKEALMDLLRMLGPCDEHHVFRNEIYARVFGAGGSVALLRDAGFRPVIVPALAEFLRQAKVEQWDALALGFDESDFRYFLRHGWESERVFILGVKRAALEGIAECSSLRRLGIYKLGIGEEGARALAALTALTELNLAGNSIGEEGTRPLAALTALTELNLAGNNIGEEGTRALAALTALTELNLASNNIGEAGARALATLTGLTSLDLSYNSIGDDGARALSSLTGLTSLDLSYNSIGDDGARALSSLTGLTSLDLSYNSIGDDGALVLLDAWASHETIGRLGLQHNNITILPQEILDDGDAQAIIAAYRRYQSSRATPLNEAKLSVVGNEAVGKTSLIRYLTKGQPRDPDEKKTPGIAHERIETQTWSPNDDAPSLNIWDFGGQEIMHETHKFFLTERSIYLLVLEDRREDDTSIYKWLRTITNRVGDSPIIVVINKCDDMLPKLLLDETSIEREWPNVVGFVRTSCNAGPAAAKSIGNLKAKILETFDDPRLAHVRDPLPSPWRRVKDSISASAKESKVLSHRDFTRLCELAEGDEAITDENEQRALLQLLHNLGAIIAYGMSRDAPSALQNVRLLDPNWLTGAIYKVLTAGLVVHQGGVFRREQLAELLDPKVYPVERWEFILSMMQHEGMALCFLLPGTSNEYLVPEALPKNEPKYDNWPADSLRFRFDYEFLPSGLIPRFIVEAHARLTNTRWRQGAVLEAGGCLVLVKGDIERRRIDVQVDGAKRQRQVALGIVIAEIERVNRLNPESKPITKVPLPDNPQIAVSYEHLLNLEDLKGPDFEYIPEGTSTGYRVGDLLDGVRSQRISPRTKPPSAVKAEPFDDSTAEQLRALQRAYMGPWGWKVFWLAAFTLLPLFFKFKSYDLELSMATVFYGAYHFLGILCWANVRQLTHQPDLFTAEERKHEVTKVAKTHKWTTYLGHFVLGLLALTGVAVATIAYGDTKLHAPLPEFVYNFLGVPQR
jgi:internalin A